MNRSVVVLDLDGVILKTNLIKYRAMLALFSEYSELQSHISEYILARGGVPRREKFAGILRELIGTPPTEALLVSYSKRYASALEHELAVAPLVEGVANFLAAGGRTFYVSSSAPESEVQHQLEIRNLSPYFFALYGAQTPKAEALRQVVLAHPASVIVFFGDAMSDLIAAQAAGVAFVGVVNERDNFADRCSVKLADFATLSRVEDCIQSALWNMPPR
ncbi:MAG: HAD hydrolase-like protein [Chloroflexi bacterium]|nr:HAD hydrolase-like protein [Chloroflexota bacterium]